MFRHIPLDFSERGERAALKKPRFDHFSFGKCRLAFFAVFHLHRDIKKPIAGQAA
jgi:hypothetical protein